MAPSARALLVVLALLAAGCISPAVPAPGRPGVEPEYRVAAPDVLAITVRPAPEIMRDVTVRPDGRISFDLVGEVDVGGKTVREIRELLEQRIKEFVVSPDVTVVLTASASRRYYVLGEIPRPGAFPLIGETTALNAIAAAGGVTHFANQDGIRLVRPGEPGAAYAVDFEGISQHGRGETNFVLEPGDVIYVPPNGFAQVGYAIGIVLFPIQQILGLGSGFFYPGGGRGGS